MKRFLSSYLILVLFAGFLTYYLWSGKKEKPPETRIFNMDKEKVNKLTIKGEEDIVLEKKNDEWKMLSPRKWEVDQELVNRMVGEISRLEAERVIKEEKPELKNYGLAKPRLRITFQGEGKIQELLVGEKTPVGYQYYAKRRDLPSVYVVSGYRLDDFFKKPEDLRERRLLRFEKNEVRKVTLVYPDKKITLEKKEEEWEITSPLKTKGDKWEIEGLLDDLKNLRIEKFVEERAEDLKKYSLDKPLFRVEIWLGKDMAYKGLDFGKEEENLVYVARSGLGQVFAVNKDKMKRLKKTLFELRDKVVFSFSLDEVKEIDLSYQDKKLVLVKEKDKWRMTHPKSGEVEKDKVEDLLWTVKDLEATSFEKEKAKDLSPYGLDKPEVKLVLKLKEGKKILYLGKTVKKGGEERVYGKVEGDPRVFTVREYIKEDLMKEPEDFFKKE